MKRREFLQYSTLSALSISPLFANPHAHHSPSNHAMHTRALRTDFITLESEHIALLDSSLMPQGQLMEPLPTLQNLSKKKGEFRAEIEIKEANIEIIKGKKTKCYIYSSPFEATQSLLAPKIEVYEGDMVIIKVKNSLKEESTIHWHGLPVPPEQDGNPMDPIAPGESRIYEFKLPKDCAGTYWYHPHPHYITSKQVYMGLAGVFVVRAKNDPLSKLSEQDWFISDLRLDKNAQIPSNGLSDWLDGREGDFVLLNGAFKPKINMAEAQRVRIYNATSARYLNLECEGCEIIMLGSDGGLIQNPQTLNTLFLAPGARAEVIIKNPKKGSFKLISKYYNRDKMMPKDEPKLLELATLDISYSFDKALIPSTLRNLPKLENPKETLHITMSEDHTKMHDLSKKSKEEIRESLAQMFLINGKVFDMNRIDLSVQKGVVYDVVVTNKSHMDHPFHIHGTQFELIETSFKGKTHKPKFRALQDTINVRANESVRLRMRQDFSGVRMFHCHILEHEDLGMMGSLLVK